METCNQMHQWYSPQVRSLQLANLEAFSRCVTCECLSGGPRTMFQYTYFSSTIIQGRYLRLVCQKRRPQITLIEVTPRALEGARSKSCTTVPSNGKPQGGNAGKFIFSIFSFLIPFFPQLAHAKL